ncbi:MAG: DUF1553 domain-containing protein [Verrucomicrobia bacterium]|nr:DUF1553 domain-containing protein [Verrucomicrobiota bacterium]
MKLLLATLWLVALNLAAAENTPPTPLPADHAQYLKDRAGNKGTPAAKPGAQTESGRQWWAFQPLRHSPPPKAKAGASSHPIDQFILEPLQAKGLGLNPSADRRTLIRRASFGLRGIPPTPEEVAAFNRDTSPAAWARLVDRFLNSPAHGERWARHWLDVARFAESSGFEHDYDRPHAYHYRDFVIKALNADMPYDQFVRWQIAGDEFEPGEPMAMMATGFLGAGVFPTQITANEVERTRYDAMDDMLSTTGTAMLGLTVGCARCHDHKYDPISIQDYYRMLATFTTTVRSNVELDLQPEVHRREKEKFDREHAPLVTALRTYEEGELPAKFDAWVAQGAPSLSPPKWILLDTGTHQSKAGATFKKLDDGSYLVQGKNGDSDLYSIDMAAPAGDLRALRLEVLADPSMVKGGPGRADNGNIGLSRIRVFASPRAGAGTNEIKLAHAKATFEQNSNNLSITSALDDNPRTGWAIDPKFGTNHAAIFEFEKPVSFEAGTHIGIRLEFDLNTRHNIGRLRLSVTMDETARFEGETLPVRVVGALQTFRDSKAGAERLSEADRVMLQNWWKRSDPGWQSLHSKVEAHARTSPKPKLSQVLVCAEGYPALRMNTQGADFFEKTYSLNRGSTDQKKEVATPGFLPVLMRGSENEQRWRVEPPAGAKYSGRRRAMANWMTDVDHGAGHLMARVIVNRLWQHHFGQGLVTTPNDFGIQGTKPTHPELLDWLATELIREGWRLKHLHKLILTSAAYQQNSDVDPSKLKADPANSLLSHRSPQRLQAEAVRDSLLFVSGLLETNMFGPGTLDPASRRRSIYFTIKRSQLVPEMQAFDAPEPLVSQGTRPVTTVAPQALMLLNSPQVRAMAAGFAKRLHTDAGQEPEAVVRRAYELALNRFPTPPELAEAVSFMDEQASRYREEQKNEALELARTDFAQVILGLNEFIYVD